MSDYVVLVMMHTWIEVILVLIGRFALGRGGPWNWTSRDLLGTLVLRLLHDYNILLVLEVATTLLKGLLSLKFMLLQRGSLWLILNGFIEKSSN